MGFKKYFEDYMSSMKEKIKDFLSLVEKNSYKILYIRGEDDCKIISCRPSKKVLSKENLRCIVYCQGKAMLISEAGNYKVLDDERVKDLESKFNRLLNK